MQLNQKRTFKKTYFFWILGVALATLMIATLHSPEQHFYSLYLVYPATGLIVWLLYMSQRSQSQVAETSKELSDIKFALDQSSIIATTDSRGIITSVNDKFCEISGFSREELLGQNHRIINSGLHSKEFFQNLWSTIRSGKVWNGEIRNKTKNGEFYWVQTVIVPFLDADGKPYQYVSLRTDISEKKKSEEALKSSLETMRHLTFRLDQAQEQERLRISREIHDEIGQALTVLKMQIFSFMKKTPEDSPQREQMRVILSSIDSIFASMRTVVADLRPVALEDLGFEGAADWWLQGVQSRTGIPCSFQSRIKNKITRAEQNLALFRILQEAVTNAIKHSNTGRLEVELSEDTDFYILNVRDFGDGFDPEIAPQRGSSGLLGMKERLRPFNGELKIQKSPTGGMNVTAFLPLNERI